MTSEGSLFPRRTTAGLTVGGIRIGGGAPVSVQSMTKTDTRNVRATLAQIRRLEKAGCEIVRLAVPDAAAAEALGRIKARTTVPLIADIHFDHRLALACLEAGVDGLRINPGNIGGRRRVEAVVKAARERSVPIRIGVNSGSLEKDLLARHGGATAEAMVESALRHIRILEDLDFRLIKVSLKASDVSRTLRGLPPLGGLVSLSLPRRDHRGRAGAGRRRQVFGRLGASSGRGAGRHHPGQPDGGTRARGPRRLPDSGLSGPAEQGGDGDLLPDVRTLRDRSGRNRAGGRTRP